MQSSSHNLDRLGVAFDDPHLVANARLLLPATLAQHLGLREVVEYHVDLGESPHSHGVEHNKPRSNQHKTPSLLSRLLPTRSPCDMFDVLGEFIRQDRH